MISNPVEMEVDAVLLADMVAHVQGAKDRAYGEALSRWLDESIKIHHAGFWGLRGFVLRLVGRAWTRESLQASLDKRTAPEALIKLYSDHMSRLGDIQGPIEQFCGNLKTKTPGRKDATLPLSDYIFLKQRVNLPLKGDMGRKKKMVYVAGPIRADTPEAVQANIARASGYMEEFLKSGWSVICPHTMYNPIRGLHPSEVFLASDFEMVRRSDYIFLCPGWQKSPGTLMEIDVAIQAGTGFLLEVCGPDDARDRAVNEPRGL